MSEVALTPRDIEVDRLRRDLRDAREEIDLMRQLAYVIALRVGTEPVFAELGLRQLADEASGHSRRMYTMAADFVEQAVVSTAERHYAELARLRRAQAAQPGSVR